MKKLWVFGCSVSDLYDSETSKYYWSSEYIKWKGYVPKHHTQIISEKLGYELINLAVSATCNSQIFQSFCDNVQNINHSDFVIIQWTEPNRVRFVNDNDEWTTFAFHSKWINHKLKNFENISFKTIQEVLVNRLNKQYRHEISSWENLIKVKMNDNFISWYPFDVIMNGRMVMSGETIKDETDGLIDDYHFSEKGQQQITDILLNRVSNKNKPII